MRYYKTTDIGLASALIATGEELIETQKDYNNPRVFFVFDSRVEDKSEDYYASRLQVDASTLVKEMRNLKSIIFNQRGEDEKNNSYNR